MNTNLPVEVIAMRLLSRSKCAVAMSAVLSDHVGIVCWGWNVPHNDSSIHAEQLCLKRANPKRIKGSTITIAGIRRKSGRLVAAYPCKQCLPLLRAYGVKRVQFHDKLGVWHLEAL